MPAFAGMTETGPAIFVADGVAIPCGGAAFPSHLPFLDTLQGRRYNGGLEPFQGRFGPGGYVRE